MDNSKLAGIGLYTVADASRLSGIAAPKLVRWLNGYERGGQKYAPLWTSQIDLGDGRVYLGFRDLMEARIADQLVRLGVPALHIRQAIILARAVLGAERPLSTNRFRTDGRTIFLRIIAQDAEGRERAHLLNLFKQQYEFSSVIDPILKNIEFDQQGLPAAWWPAGAAKKILVDPARSFGQPIDSESSVPVAILANAGKNHGVTAAAKSYAVPKASIRRAMEFTGVRELQRAA
jgi:hypothetical protein